MKNVGNDPYSPNMKDREAVKNKVEKVLKLTEGLTHHQVNVLFASVKLRLRHSVTIKL